MVVQHNMQAMNANRMLGVTTSSQGKTTEKLSSGYKINRAADDAAGLAISEKMRKQCRGLDRGSMNAQDGVSCVQTAEGALNEVHAMLQRMNELAVQAANGTNSDSDRQAIQNEVNQLLEEMDRVSETTKFNETMLLKGDPTGATKQLYMNFHDAGLRGKAEETLDSNGAPLVHYELGPYNEGEEVNIGGVVYTIRGVNNSVNLSDMDHKIVSMEDATRLACQELVKANSFGVGEWRESTAGPWGGGIVISYETQTSIAHDINHSFGGPVANGGYYSYIDVHPQARTVPRELNFNLQAGADSALNNKISVDIQSFNTIALGIQNLDIVGKAGDNGIMATYAIDAIKDALQKVSDQRAELGAIQNRLEHTIANLDNVVENTTAAESRVRDTDMAEAMVEHAKQNILAQAGQSMLAQANSSTQGVMSLLQ
ncbi:MAG: flagellar hook protein [Lachnospiraceae bacterium]|nr:flagellar hook protein [Lachnospiraceae bacterium]